MTRFRQTLLALSVFLTGCVSLPNDWSRQDTVGEVTYQILNVADAITTAQIQHDPNLVEAGPIAARVLGENPENGEVVMYFGTLAVSHAIISMMLPQKWRPWWQGGTVVYTGIVVANNCNLGLCN